MKISIDNQELFTLNETKKKVIQNDIASEIFEDDMKRRVEWALMHKYDQCMKRLKQEWEPKLIQDGVTMFPTNDDDFAELVFAHSKYKNKSQRDAIN